MRISSIPNILSYLRLFLIPVLWIIYLYSTKELLAVMILLTGSTDIIDGYIARKLNNVSKYGSKLDSAADNSVAVSMIYWTYNITPEIFVNHSSLIILWSSVLILSTIVGMIKFGRIGNLHLYSSKAAALSSYIFVIHAFLFGYSQLLFYISISLLIVAAAEILFIQILRKDVHENMGSLLIRR